MKCTKCGSEIPSGNKFCRKCGTPVNNSGITNNSPGVNSNGKRGKSIMITIVTVVGIMIAVLLIGIGGYMLVKEVIDKNDREQRWANRTSEASWTNSISETSSTSSIAEASSTIGTPEASSTSSPAVYNTYNQTVYNTTYGQNEASSTSGTTASSSTSGTTASSSTSSTTSSTKRSDYILPGSDSRYISEQELYGLTQEQCRIARNELYARHGRKFKDTELQNYFNQFDWYHPSIEADDFSDSMLNSYENANRNLLVEYEKKQGWR